MHPTKLDPKRSFAHVYGHKAAMFEQDGKLFDGGGMLLNERSKQKEEPESEVEDPTEGMSAPKAFLVNMLSGTAMSKKNLVREAVVAEISWDEVQEAAHEMGVVEYNQGKTEMWKLTDE